MCAEKKVVNEKAFKNIATGTREENIFDGVRIMCKFQLIIKLLLISTYSLKWGKKKAVKLCSKKFQIPYTHQTTFYSIPKTKPELKP